MGEPSNLVVPEAREKMTSKRFKSLESVVFRFFLKKIGMLTKAAFNGSKVQ